MLSELFYILVNMSIIGGLVSSILLCLRRVKKIPKSFVYLMWVVPFIRLIFPVAMTNQYSLMNLVSKFTTKTVVVYETTKSLPQLAFTNSVMAAKEYFPIRYKTNLLEGVFHVISFVWIIVATAAIFTTVLLYVFTKAEIKEAVLYKDNIYRSNRISSPALFGIFHPKIILPFGLNETDLNYVILHEKAHAVRHDNLWRCIAVLICCVHWFNPVCWISLKYVFEDMELSCDHKVLQKLNREEAKAYAYAVLNVASQTNLFVSAFGGAKTKIRMENILSYRKLTLFSSIAFTAFVIAIIIVLTTNAAL